MDVELHFTPAPFVPGQASGRTVVVIDVLRATTSICYALRAGARAVVPVAEPGEAAELRSRLGTDLAVLAGERDGVRIDGFNLGNSPLEFTREAVADKVVVMTTTNGTATFQRAGKARLVLSAALVNISRVVERVAEEPNDLTIICAGRRGGFAIEDALCGGMLLHRLEHERGMRLSVNDAGMLALMLYRARQATIKQAILEGEHGRFLTGLGFARDVEAASQVDAVPVLPVLRDGRLTAVEGR